MSEPIRSFKNKLRWKFENVLDLDENTRYSDEFNIRGVKWKIGIRTTIVFGGTYLHTVLNYSIEENQKAWTCSVNGECFLLENQKLSNKRVIEENDCMQNNEIGNTFSTPWSTIRDSRERYVENGAIIIQFNFNFIFQNFSRNIENQTDIKLKVGGTDVYYKKEILCSQSNYFHDLLNGESNRTITEVTIDEDVKLEEFLIFLIAIQPKSFLTTSKLLECLKLAEKFEANTIVVNISQRLFSHFEVIKKEQNKSIDSQLFIKCIQFAEKYNYDEIMFMAISCLKTAEEVKRVSNVDGFENLENTTKVNMFLRLLDFL